MAKRQDADAGGLRHPAKVRDRDARHAVDRREAVELERIDDEVEAVGLLALGFGGVCGNALYCCGHSALPDRFLMRTSSSSSDVKFLLVEQFLAVRLDIGRQAKRVIACALFRKLGVAL